ncbi:MAG: glutamyl-tRNA reductase [Spirochaetia bacterium]|nr:glutamyl-tRNA reductase [Spirochaetia bacterium]
MKIAALVIAHPQAPAELRERLQKDIAEIKKTFEGAVSLAILSTCHRFEIHWSGENAKHSQASLWDALAKASGIEPDQLKNASRFFTELEAAGHLFRVASGLESAVLGENEILGQVRACMEDAAGSGTLDSDLRMVFESALRVGKKVRSHTSLGQGSSSLASAALALIKTRFPKERFGKTRVLILGSGEMASRFGKLLKDRGFSNLRVASRSLSNAAKLASKIGASSHGLDEIPGLLKEADLAVSLLSHAPEILKLSMFDFVEAGNGRSFLLIDMGLPRNAEPSLKHKPGLELFDIDDLGRSLDSSMGERRKEIEAAEVFIAEELKKLSAALETKGLPPHRRRLRSLREREALLSEEEAFEPASISHSLSEFS